jgi:hypothetical protein
MPTDRFYRLAFFAAWSTGIIACGDDAAALDETDTVDSGFTNDGDSTAGTSVDDTGGTTSGGAVETFGEGDVRGILTFAFYPDDPVTRTDLVGLAGAWRPESLGFDEVDDFFGVYALQTTFPPPPSGDDELVQNAVPTPFDWGRPDDWLRAGNGMKLVSGDTEALACLLMVGGEYPVYVASHSMLHPEGCQPDVASWLPDTAYDIVLYGGDLFETNVLYEQVHTPPAFDVSAPDIGHFNLHVPLGEPLQVAWTDNGNPGNRVVIRMSDMFGRMFTVNAVDDGSYAIAAAAMAELAPGPVTLTIAREQIDLVPFTEGVVKVVTRYEHWGYLELR